MGAEHSKLPYNVENPRRLKDIVGWEKTLQDFKKSGPNEEEQEQIELFSTLTAPEFKIFMVLLLGVGMEKAMFDPSRAEKEKAAWKPWISVVNASGEQVHATMKKTWPTEETEGDVIEIPAGSIGKLPLPTEVDFNRDYPLNGILGTRLIVFRFPDCAVRIFNCNNLNYGHSRGDVRIDAGRKIEVCAEVPKDPPKQETAEEQAMGEEIRDFMAEAADPNCPQVTEARYDEIAALVMKWAGVEK